MKAAFSLLLVFCCVTVLAQQKNTTISVSPDPDTIHWRADYKLKPEDFKGTPERNSRFGAVTRASTEFDSRFKNDTNLVFTAFCIFNKKLSWINPHDLDSNLIEHEQGHFDIAEIFRRKLEAELRFLETCNYKKEKKYVDSCVNSIFDKIVEERAAFDETYDKACAFPPNPTNQKIWTQKIQRLLTGSDTENAVTPIQQKSTGKTKHNKSRP